MKSEDLQEIRSIIQKANRVTFLGGAGVSTDSGIMDFRSPKGLYNIKSKYGVPYEEMLSHDYFYSHTKDFYSFYWEAMVDDKAMPNKAHIALAEFEKSHPTFSIITQNIDGLHQKAGSKRVYEVHGSTRFYHCLRCEKEFSVDELDHHGIPHCDACGALIKPDVVLYGEGLPEEAIEASLRSIQLSDVLIIGGTSMRVYPVAAFPDYMLRGTKIIINAEPTPYDDKCDYVLRGNIGEILEAILK